MNHSKKIVLASLTTLLVGVSTYSLAATGEITGTGVRVRKEATTESEIITNLYKGDEVEVIEKSGDWYKISYEGKEGYTHKDYIKVEEELASNNEQQIQNENNENNENTENNENIQEPVTEEIKEEKILEKKVKQQANIYILPVIYSSVTDIISQDKVVTVNQVINGWSNISCEGINGWIRNCYLVETTTQTTNTVEPKKAYVNVSSYANIRQSATTDSQVVTTAKNNTEVTIIGEENGWYKIQIADKQGYILKDLVSDTKNTVTNRSQELPRNTETTKVQEVANVTEKTTTETTANKQTTQKVNVQETKVETPAVKQETTSKVSTGNSIVSYAKKYLGYKYVLGGASPSAGFDCSGFTYYVYKHFGVTLNRRASQQIYNGTKVEKANLQPGDLIIFNDMDNVEPGHCGIYVGGNQFIHAANSKRGVVIDYMDSRNSYYNARYVEARRII